MAKARRDVDLTHQLAAEVRALGALLDGRPGVTGSASRAVAAAVEVYAAGQPRPSVLDTYAPERVKAFVDDEIWDAAKRRADIEGISIPTMLGEFVPKLITFERQRREEEAGLE